MEKSVKKTLKLQSLSSVESSHFFFIETRTWMGFLHACNKIQMMIMIMEVVKDGKSKQKYYEAINY
jgi:hypothetical protein